MRERERRCEDEKAWEKVWRWEGVKTRRCERGCERSRCEEEQMWRWEDVKMRRCEDEQMWRWEGVREDVKMRRCEDEKMRYRPPLLEEPCAQTLSGKNEEAYRWASSLSLLLPNTDHRQWTQCTHHYLRQLDMEFDMIRSCFCRPWKLKRHQFGSSGCGEKIRNATIFRILEPDFWEMDRKKIRINKTPFPKEIDFDCGLYIYIYIHTYDMACLFLIRQQGDWNTLDWHLKVSNKPLSTERLVRWPRLLATWSSYPTYDSIQG